MTLPTLSDGTVVPTSYFNEVKDRLDAFDGGTAGATIVNVKDEQYGAVGDGVTDDTAAIQAAMTALGSAGGSLYFPVGTYLVSSRLTITGPIRLLGSGQGNTIIKGDPAFTTDDSFLYFDGGSALGGLAFQDLQFDGNRAAGCSAKGIHIEDTFDVLFLRTTWKNFHDQDVVPGIGGNPAIEATRCINFHIAHSHFIDCDTGVSALAVGGSITGNTAYSNDVIGFNADQIGATVQSRKTRLVIVGNDVSINGTDAGIPGHGIRVTNSNNFLVANNVCHGNFQYGILMYNNCTEGTVVGNDCRSNQRNGIISEGVPATGPNTRLLINANKTNENTFNGIRLFETYDTSCCANHATGNDVGIAEDTNSNRNQVCLNDVRDNNLGINRLSGTNSIYVDNTEEDTVSTQRSTAVLKMEDLARRDIADGLLALLGGTTFRTGARLRLYGADEANNGGRIFLDGAMRDAAGTGLPVSGSIIARTVTAVVDTMVERMMIGAGTTDVPVTWSQAYHDLTEVATPAAPGSNKARFFARDNGAGKTQLCVVFPTGAVQVIATEP